MARFPFLMALLLFPGAAQAQRRWIVDIDNRPGAQFTDVASAVAAASSGDTLVVRASGAGYAYPFGFTTSKGLTIVGSGRPQLFMYERWPLVVANLPANESFRLAGFAGVSGYWLFVEVRNCLGSVLIEDVTMGARAAGMPLPPTPTFLVDGSRHVMLNAVEAYGVSAVSSAVTLVRCRIASNIEPATGGLGCLYARNAEIDVAEPAFDAQPNGGAAIEAHQSIVRVGGTAASYLQGGHPFGPTAAHAIWMTNGTLRIDPRIRLNPFDVGPTIGGSGTITTVDVPCTLTTGASTPGLTLGIELVGTPGAPAILLLGAPAQPLATPLGAWFLDPSSAFLVRSGLLGANGTLSVAIPVPITTPRGVAIGAQGAQLGSSGGEFAIGNHFVVH